MTSAPLINVGDIFLQEGSSDYYVVVNITPSDKLFPPKHPCFITRGVQQFSLLDKDNEISYYYLTEQQFFLTFGKNQIKTE